MNERELRSRLAWRCRRGTKELDLLLLRWLAGSYASATAEQRAGFEALLDLPDPELSSYLLGAERPREPLLAAAVAALCRPAEPSSAATL